MIFVSKQLLLFYAFSVECHLLSVIHNSLYLNVEGRIFTLLEKSVECGRRSYGTTLEI